MEGSGSDPGVTALHRNAFHVLGASAGDSRREIVRLAEQKALILPEADVRRARAELTQPRPRLGAEIGWLPGVDPDVTKQLLGSGRLDADIVSHARVPALSQANVRAAMFEDRLAKQQHPHWATYELPAFLSLVDRIDAAGVTEMLNAHREASGFPLVDVAQVREALNEQRRYYLSVCHRALDRLGLASRQVVLGKALDESDAEAHFVHDLIDAYELDQSAAIDEAVEALDDIADRIARDPAPNGAPLFQLKNRLPQYAKIVQPILRSRAMRGLDHRPTENLVWKLRATALDIGNNRDEFETSYAVVTSIRDAFSGVPSVQGAVTRDIEQLETILEQVRRMPSPNTPPAPPHPPRRQPAPPPAQPVSRESTQRKGGAWKAVAAIAVLLFLVNMVSSDDGDATRPTGDGPSGSTVTRDRCDGVDDWWDATNGRVDRAYLLWDSLGSFPTQRDILAAQRQLLAIASEQRLSDPPSAAMPYSRARADEFEMMATALTDTSMSSFEWDREFSEVHQRIQREANSLGSECDFRIRWEEEQES